MQAAPHTASHQEQGAGWFVRRAVTSSLGAKVIMAVTGLLFFLWLILHLLGNLAIFAGAEEMNAYAYFLASKPELLWTQRVGLAAIVIAHVLSAVRLARLNAAARPQPYAVRRYRQASLASRTMLISGLVALAYIVFHLLHFTGGVVLPQYYAANLPIDPAQHHDVYGMVTKSFAHAWVVLIYLVGMLAVGLHLSHGLWSFTQSLGLWGKRYTPWAQRAARVLGWGYVLVFLAIPFSVLLGLLK